MDANCYFSRFVEFIFPCLGWGLDSYNGLHKPDSYQINLSSINYCSLGFILILGHQNSMAFELIRNI
jgi:hypothetical protein